MKKYLYCISLCISHLAFGQYNIAVTNATADAVMAGNYTPTSYNSGINGSASTISSALNQSISADSLKAYVRKLAGFGTRNTNTIANTSTITGLGAANNWVEAKFRQLSAQRNNRLLVSRMTFTAAVCTSASKSYSEVFAVLPGTVRQRGHSQCRRSRKFIFRRNFGHYTDG